MSQNRNLSRSSEDILGITPRRVRCAGCGREFISLNGHLARAPTCARINQTTSNSEANDADNDESPRTTVVAVNEALKKLEEVYGAPFLNGPGGENPEYSVWRGYWRKISQLGGRHYDLPNGPNSAQFVDLLAGEVNSLAAGRFPSERVLVFISVLLQRNKMIKQPKDIRILLGRRLKLWTDGQFDTLLNEALSLDKKLNSKHSKIGSNQAEVTFHRLMQRGKVREAVGRLSDSNNSSVLSPCQVIDGNGKTVLDDLKEKHPDSIIPEADMLHLPEGIMFPPLIEVQVTSGVVEKVARKLHGSGGPGGSEADQWVDFLLRHGKASHRLREAVALLTTTLCCADVPWESIRALMASRLVALDKRPGVRPIGIGECLRRVMGKCMAEVTGEEVTESCKERQLCGGLSGGVEGAVHSMNSLFEENATPHSNWGLLLVDAKNAFNSVNRVMALWQARLYWPSCARFLYNTYKGQAELVLRGNGDNLYSREGVTQGDPLAMLLYGISTLPLIHQLQNMCPAVTQCWYADDSSAQGTFDQLKTWWGELLQHGPAYGYHPQGHKSFLVVRSSDREEAERIFRGSGIKIVAGHRFLGGFVGDPAGKKGYLEEKVHSWGQMVQRLSAVGEKYPQDAHTAYSKSMQFQWQFAQRVVDGGEEVYLPLRDMIRTKFMPAILGGNVSNEECDLFSLPVGKGGLAWSDPVRTANLMYHVSRAGTTVLGDSLRLGHPFNIDAHMIQQRTAKADGVRDRDQAEEQLLESVLEKFDEGRQRTIGRTLKKKLKAKTSGWLSALPLKRHNFDLSPLEFRDALAVRYKRSPVGMPASCDGCGSRHFSLEHALSCKTGGLITRRHNEVRDLMGELMTSAWGNCVKEPIIVESSDTGPGLRGDLACRGVWEPQREALFDIRVVDTDAPSYASHPVAAVLSRAEEEKKRKYLPACEERHASFTPLVCSVDATSAPQMEAFIRVLAEKISGNWGRPQSQITGWLRARIAFAIIRATSMCIRGIRRKWRSCEELIGFSDGAGLRLGLN